MDMEKIIDEIKNLQESVAKLERENNNLKKRVSHLEGTDRDLRIKAKRVLGFTMSNVRGYYNAVRTINGGQVRIYIGKKTDIAEKKIMAYLLENVSWLQGDIESCEDLMAIKELAKAVKDAKHKSAKGQKQNELASPVNVGDGITLVSEKKYNNDNHPPKTN